MSDDVPPPIPPDGLLKREHFTAERVRFFAEQMARHGKHPLMTEEARAASRRATLGEIPEGQGLWVFGYGSLMWNPALNVARSRPLHIEGYRRRFCLTISIGRGTPDRPGLMLGLVADPAANCTGTAHFIAPEHVESETEILWHREMLSGAYRPTWIAAPVEEGRVLAFVIDREHPRYEGQLSEDAAAARIAAGEGVLGTNRDYLYRTARHLAECGVEDEEIFRLERRVRALTGEPANSSQGETP